MRAALALWVICALVACADAPTLAPLPTTPPVAAPTPTTLISGTAFLTPETQALQADDFANPAMLWVDKGADIFARDCASCHADDPSIKTAATRYPALNPATGRLINLEGRINHCRVAQMNSSALPYESEALLSLTAYVGHQSRGLPLAVGQHTQTAKDYAAGERYFFTRRGQFNLSCAQCHNTHWGQNLRGDTLSQGHGNGFPAYRLEWEGVGSLHRRFADCDRGVRAEPHPLGSEIYTQLELYLAVRAQGLTVETPAVRR